ncbi:MAG: hypothetical protein ABW321_14835 [Polyangiales bacterium]
MRISNSFSEGEIQCLEFIVQTLLRGGTPTMVTRNKEFPSLCRKVMGMKNRVNEQKARPVRDTRDERDESQESSVGTVEAPVASQLAEHADTEETTLDIARAV